MKKILEDLYRDIAQKEEVLEKYEVKAKSWKTWACRDLIAFLEPTYSQIGSRHVTIQEQLKASVEFLGYQAESGKNLGNKQKCKYS